MGKKKKVEVAKKLSEAIEAKKPVDVKTNPKAPEQSAGIRTAIVTAEDKVRLMKAFVNHKSHCQMCNHQQSLDDCKALILGTYLTGEEENAHYDINTGVLTITGK